MDDSMPEGFLSLAVRERLDRVRATARAVLRDDYKARDFLARPHRQLDQRRQQVLVEAIIVEISETAARVIGSWSAAASSAPAMNSPPLFATPETSISVDMPFEISGARYPSRIPSAIP